MTVAVSAVRPVEGRTVLIRWLSAFGVALAVSGAALPHLAEPAAANA